MHEPPPCGDGINEKSLTNDGDSQALPQREEKRSQSATKNLYITPEGYSSALDEVIGSDTNMADLKTAAKIPLDQVGKSADKKQMQLEQSKLADDCVTVLNPDVRSSKNDVAKRKFTSVKNKSRTNSVEHTPKSVKRKSLQKSISLKKAVSQPASPKLKTCPLSKTSSRTETYDRSNCSSRNADRSSKISCKSNVSVSSVTSSKGHNVDVQTESSVDRPIAPDVLKQMCLSPVETSVSQSTGLSVRGCLPSQQEDTCTPDCTRTSKMLGVGSIGQPKRKTQVYDRKPQDNKHVSCDTSPLRKENDIASCGTDAFIDTACPNQIYVGKTDTSTIDSADNKSSAPAASSYESNLQIKNNPSTPSNTPSTATDGIDSNNDIEMPTGNTNVDLHSNFNSNDEVTHLNPHQIISAQATTAVEVQCSVAPVEQHINDGDVVRQILIENRKTIQHKPFKLRRSYSDGNFIPKMKSRVPDFLPNNRFPPPRTTSLHSSSAGGSSNTRNACADVAFVSPSTHGYSTDQIIEACCNMPAVGARLAHCDVSVCSQSSPCCMQPQIKTLLPSYAPINNTICSDSPSPQPCSCFHKGHPLNSYVSCQEQLTPYEYQQYESENGHAMLFSQTPQPYQLNDPKFVYTSQSIPMQRLQTRRPYSTPDHVSLLPVSQQERLLQFNLPHSQQPSATPPHLLEHQPLPPTPQSTPSFRFFTSLNKKYEDDSLSPVAARHGGLFSGCCQYPGMLTHFNIHDAYGTKSAISDEESFTFSRPHSDILPNVSFEHRVQNTLVETGLQDYRQRSPAKLHHSLHCSKPDLLNMESCSPRNLPHYNPAVVSPSCLLIPCADPGLDLRYIDTSPATSPIPVTRSKSCDSALYRVHNYFYRSPQENYSALHPSNFGYNTFEGYADSRCGRTLSLPHQAGCSFEGLPPCSSCDCESEHTSRSGTVYDSVNVSTNPSSINEDIEDDDDQAASTNITDDEYSYYIDEDGFEKKKKVTFQLPCDQFGSAHSVRESCK